MRQSQLFTRVERHAPKEEVALNAQLLTRGGFIYKNSAGVYSYLPLGWRVIQKISAIIREEMNAIGGQELLMAALHDKHYLEATGRWNVPVVFKVISGEEKTPSFNMSWTHEEILAEIAAQYVRSYKDLPFAAYQIQTKFRYEPRAKSGLLRGREFLMKDLYSFHTSEEDLFRYYAEVAKAYHRIFERCGLVAYYTLAAGGDFTLSNTHEFQVVSDVGEDTIYVCEKCGYAENDEISKLKDGGECPRCGGKVSVKKAIEVGNIFPLGVKYSEAFGLKFKDETGQEKPVVMGSYGIGVSRLMGVCAEIFHDDHGLVWPSAVAPFDAHLIVLPGADAAASQQVRHRADALYDQLTAAGVEVLYDDRQELTAGEKFAQADVIGIPWRLVVSQKTGDRVEIKKRSDTVPTLVDFHQAAQYCIRT